MRTLYNDMDIRFSLEGVSFHALNIVFEHFERTIPAATRSIIFPSAAESSKLAASILI